LFDNKKGIDRQPLVIPDASLLYSDGGQIALREHRHCEDMHRVRPSERHDPGGCTAHPVDLLGQQAGVRKVVDRPLQKPLRLVVPALADAVVAQL
jgi:hypothetical protein